MQNVQVTDIVGETLSITEDDLPFNVFVDTVSPRIDLGGPADHNYWFMLTQSKCHVNNIHAHKTKVCIYSSLLCGLGYWYNYGRFKVTTVYDCCLLIQTLE